MFWVKDRVTNLFSLIAGENVFSAWHSNLIVSLLKNYISQPQTKCEFLPISLMMKMMTMTTMMVMTMMMMMMNHSPAPSPPGRVVAVSGGTGDLLVAWTPPNQPNGRLLQYTVTTGTNNIRTGGQHSWPVFCPKTQRVSLVRFRNPLHGFGEYD